MRLVGFNLILSIMLIALSSDLMAQDRMQSWPMPTASDTLWDTRFARPGINTSSEGVTAMVADGKYLYVAGYFASIGPHRSKGLMRWNGETWEDLSQGFSRRPAGGEHYGVSFSSLALDSSGNLYVAGTFDSIYGKAASRIAKWDGKTWHDYAKGLSSARDGHALSHTRQRSYRDR